MRTVVWKSVAFETVLYFMIAIAGYLSMLTETPALIITRPAITNSRDYLMMIGRFGVILKLLTSLSLS